MSQISTGQLHNFTNGETVTDGGTAGINTFLNVITAAHNDTDTKVGTLGSLIKSSGSINQKLGEVFGATQGQTVFTLTKGTYIMSNHMLDVWVNGVKKSVDNGDFTETSNTSFTMANGLNLNDKVDVEYWQSVTATPAQAAAHATTHSAGGTDPIDIVHLQNYQTEVADKIGILSDSVGSSIENYASLQDALTAIGSQNKTLVISKDTVISANATIPSNIILKFVYPYKFTIASGVVLTINGGVDAGFQQIFSFADSTAKVTTTNPGQWNVAGNPTIIHQRIKVDWFGAKPDAVPPNSFSSNTNQLPTGTDSSDGFRRAFAFAMNASISMDAYQKTPRVTVEAAPNGSYLLIGHNLMGCQSTSPISVNIDFDGNGCQILHKITANSDTLIANAYLIYEPFYRNFSVDVYNDQTQTRWGRFLDLNGAGKSPIQFYRPKFENIRISQSYINRGYDIIFNIDGSTMADNGDVNKCEFGSYNILFNCLNGQAVNWTFRKCWLGSNTANGTNFYFADTYSGSFTVDGCEMIISETNECMLMTRGTTVQSSKFRIINGRLESRNSNVCTIFDMDFGVLEVEGIDYTYGSGGALPSASTRTGRVGIHAAMRFKDCTVPEDFNVVVDITGNTGKFHTALKFENTNFFPSTNRGSGYPFIHLMNQSGTEVTWKTALTSGYQVRRIIVDAPRYNDYKVNIPIEYGTYFAKLQQTFDLYRLYNGVPLLNDNSFPTMPYNCVITSIKLFCNAVSAATIDNVQMQLYTSSGGLWSLPAGTLNVALSGSAIYGQEMLPTNQYLSIPNVIVKLSPVYRLSTTQVTDDTVKPTAWVQITYRAIKSVKDYGASETSPQLVSLF